MARPWQRRAFLGASVAAMASTIPTPRLPAGAEIVRKSFTYKTVGDCAITADVFRRVSTATTGRSRSGFTAVR